MTPNDNDSHWILIRGLARESRHWGEFPKLLSSNLARENHLALVDTIDLPGTGRYSEMRSPVSIHDITTFVREKYLEIRSRMRSDGIVPPKKTYIVALSLGGMVTCDWLERWPDDMNGIVLINTSFKGFSPIYRRLTVGAAAQLLKTASINDVFERELNVLKLVSNRPENYEELAHVWAKIQLSRPVSVENFARQLLAAALYQPQLPQPSQPVLVLNSVKDRMVHPSCSEKIATKWRATLTRHPTAGHDLSVDDGPWVAEQITTWISQGK